ncbi:C6 zinc finger domain-containing protein [Histoplasma capsulatum var. duboisii H88]|uniref:C6 zinc finger domain-containing protein n=1 Tax=Ajellomyces capsulatus (strain H88) TaxID=544711 RepID=F0UE14_AJEC8|nr:C6 zinc finger domain-containing protein [Histoplasma capsulatum var. duboisii H88]
MASPNDPQNSQPQFEKNQKQTARKKFAKPPVKVACLSCKRGGPRKKKVGQSSGLGLEPFPDPSLQEAVFVQFDSLAVPGAGLRHLDFPPQDQSMFDSLRVPVSGGVSPPALAAEPTSPSRVRVYGNEDDILNGYYIFIHQYFPIFPPAHSPITIDRPLDFPGKSSNQKLGMDTPLGYIPKSPISLAISAILALVPHPKDLKPSSPESVRLRRSYAQWFSRASLESVETESEIAESGANPSQALLNEHPIPKRPSLHPHVPVELEAILALLILSVYEYAQRGNLVKMRHRAGQAFVTAMNMSLHALPPEDSIYAEARRRAWWMTCWPLLMRAQHALIAGTQFIIDLNQTLKSRGDMSYIYERMKKIDAWIRPVLAQANTAPPVSPVSGITDSEAITAQSIRKICLIKLSSALIKTHRFRAFLDIPIFIKKHCDLTCASIGYLATEADAQGSSKHCCADTNLYDIPPIPLPGQSPSSCSTTSDISGPTTSSSTWVDQDSFPFTNQQSTEICLTSALTIAHMFHTLPYPVPVYGDKDLPDLSSRAQSPSHELSIVAPRTMPSFACCAMQSSYAMLMLYYKSRVVDQNIYVEGRPLNFSEELTEELQYGLECVISAVRNYSRVFEALDGMREEIESAFMMAFAQVQ